MSVPATADWFSFSIRRNRRSFILASIMLWVIIFGVMLFLRLVKTTTGWETLVLAAFYLPAMICSWSLTSQRLRDLNVTGWLALLWIPVNIADTYLGGAAALAFVIVLVAIPGTTGPNRYGPDPLEDGLYQ